MELVTAIVLAAIILYYLRTAVTALNIAERYYTAFTLVLAKPSCVLQSWNIMARHHYR